MNKSDKPPVSEEIHRSLSLQQHYQRLGERAVGGLLLVMVICSLLNGLFSLVPAYLAGLFGWIAALLLITRVNALQRLQVVGMLVIGTGGLVYGLVNGTSINPARVISVNQSMIAMLAAVSFLRLVTQPPDVSEALPQGGLPLWRTLFGIHFLGSVINMSAIVIIGDRLSANRPLSAQQACVISRGFALAACWSPFFAAMGIALASAPGAEIATLGMVGLPIALCGLMITGWSLTHRDRAANFYGYPMRFTTLWIPALLALLLMLLHHLYPQIPILTLVALLSLSLSLVILLLRHGANGLTAYRQHVSVGLPRMSAELMLFLAAGVLASGMGAIVTTSGLTFDGSTFGASEASLMLALMVGISVLGVHPVISIATTGGILAPIGVNPNLLGITFLMTWAIGVSTTPLSGLHLMIQGRYQIRGWTLFKMNYRFSLVMLSLAILVLHGYEALG